MPELPEVEVTRRSISGIEGSRVLAARLGKPLRWPLGCAPEALAGNHIGPVQRRGKYLWLPLSRDGQAAGGLLLHLGMSGSLAWGSHPGPVGPHTHFELQTTSGWLQLTDPRRFGAVVWSAGLDVLPACALLARLGAEPFDPALDAPQLHAAWQARRIPIKTALLAGREVVGVGNIYASEALFEAGIHPHTPCAALSLPQVAGLLAAIRRILGEAIAAGGSTLRDFQNAHGIAGAYQQTQVRVYGRAGQACNRCGATITRVIQGQRATYFCPNCQH